MQLTANGDIDLILEIPYVFSMKNHLYNFNKFSEDLVSLYTYQILKGIKYMHDKGVIHRNLKCSNILMNGEGEIKISDGGAQRKLIDAINRRTVIDHVEDGPHYLPPEVLQGQGFCKSSDIWVIGCCMIEMLTGKPPWSELGSDN